MEGRVVLLNGENVAVRLSDSSYSVFRVLPPSTLGQNNAYDIGVKGDVVLEVGDSFLGPLATIGPQVLLHCRTQTWIEVQIKLARSQVAARTKRYLLTANPRVAP
ncbi:MAG: hypothetical protein H7249_06865 [Chitinophagaceae bacterium]|nr:hypothetical protein [Oligoflexus sp.]